MKQKKEIWRNIPGYEGYYQVSNEGNVKGLDRTVLTKNGQERFYKGRNLNFNNKQEYNIVALSKNGKKRGFNVSQLIAMTFLKHTPDGHSLVIDHINGIKTDNRVENLQIVTQRQNISTCHRKDRDSFYSEYVGVSYNNNNQKWLGSIRYNDKQIHLGYYNNEEDASNAYQKALAKLENGTFYPEDYKPKWTSKYKGVSYYKTSQKWLCQPYFRGKQVYLGYFASEEEAHQAILEFEAIQPIVKNS